jgi:hypothetical protein
MHGSLVPPPGKLTTDPEELAEYHFHLARAYEFWGWIGAAHRHYEIVHDRYGGYGVSVEATRKMEELRKLPAKDAGIVGFHGFTRHGDCYATDYSVPSLNAWTTVAGRNIWPPVTEEKWTSRYVQKGVILQSYRVTKSGFQLFARFLGTQLYGPIPAEPEFKPKDEPEWSIPGSAIPWLREAARTPIFGIWY